MTVTPLAECRNPADIDFDPGPPVAAPPTRTNAEPTLDVFARGPDNQLYHRWWKPGVWTGWESLRGDLAAGVGVGTHNSGILHLGILGRDGKIYDRSFTNGGPPMLLNGWSGWTEPGTGLFSSAPSPTSWGTDHFAMFALDTEGKVRQNTYRFGGPGWTGWNALPGDRTFGSAPAAVAYDVNRLHVFVKGAQDRIYDIHLKPEGGWTEWAPIGTLAALAGPATVSWGPTHLALFVVGRDDRKVWHNTYDFGVGWGGWTQFSGGETFTDVPAAVSHAPGTLNVFALGTDGRIWERHRVPANGTWTSWVSTGDQTFTSGPASASWSNR
ncbi:hypothetical protein ABGB14_11590 [Nonomuraea sp. B10E15]|uniref:hypothetical protein n=1 Tax=Nonomuraea sp. B10E15 TaxID=3153560 RepID=UPI00325DC78B